ncbi:5268_t:CDS:2, partial [Acaulospora morrowiae]
IMQAVSERKSKRANVTGRISCPHINLYLNQDSPTAKIDSSAFKVISLDVKKILDTASPNCTQSSYHHDLGMAVLNI